jgi:CelD/BcsL family acetyltransferase involved in cellulose biosynthesis
LTVYTFNPLEDPRWAEFVQRHPRASVFHTPGWLEALRRTYGYEPVTYTTTPPGSELTNGVVLCRVYSRITGRRMVSLPFSDHCEPLFERPDDLEDLLHSLELECTKERWKYVEIRPRTACAVPPGGLEPAQAFYFHALDLKPKLAEILNRFHKESTYGKIRRAEREGLTYEEGRSATLLEKFYQLLLRTRRRQQLPPHPSDWFRNLVDCLGDTVKISTAAKDGRPIASILTLFFKDVLVYKYGCSDERFHNLGGMSLLLWNAIKEGKGNGAREFDMGRSDSDNPGLITFKEHWGAARSRLTYWRYPTRLAPAAAAGWRMHAAQKIFAHIPDTFLIAAGKMFYRHMG